MISLIHRYTCKEYWIDMAFPGSTSLGLDKAIEAIEEGIEEVKKDFKREVTDFKPKEELVTFDDGTQITFTEEYGLDSNLENIEGHLESLYNALFDATAICREAAERAKALESEIKLLEAHHHEDEEEEKLKNLFLEEKKERYKLLVNDISYTCFKISDKTYVLDDLDQRVLERRVKCVIEPIKEYAEKCGSNTSLTFEGENVSQNVLIFLNEGIQKVLTSYQKAKEERESAEEALSKYYKPKFKGLFGWPQTDTKERVDQENAKYRIRVNVKKYESGFRRQLRDGRRLLAYVDMLRIVTEISDKDILEAEKEAREFTEKYKVEHGITRTVYPWRHQRTSSFLEEQEKTKLQRRFESIMGAFEKIRS